MITDLRSINDQTHEGRCLMAALAKLTTESQADKQPDEVVAQVVELAAEMYKDAAPLEGIWGDQSKAKSFEDELSRLINRHSMENGSDTPDFILASYLQNCLDNFHRTVRARSRWYGGHQTIGGIVPNPEEIGDTNMGDKAYCSEPQPGPFETDANDGGDVKAERIIVAGGGTITKNGFIQYEGEDPKVLEAINFLCSEWDYAWPKS